MVIGVIYNYIDHEVLKSLLNTPQPSGGLARWGMALQELNLHFIISQVKLIRMQMLCCVMLCLTKMTVWQCPGQR